MVFNDAVVHDGNFALAIQVGVSIYLAWFAMGGPTGVGNGNGSRTFVWFRKRAFQFDDLSLFFVNVQLTLGMRAVPLLS